MSVSATPRALELIIVEQTRVWLGLRGTPSEAGALEALAESVTEYERQLQKSAEAVARDRTS